MFADQLTRDLPYIRRMPHPGNLTIPGCFPLSPGKKKIQVAPRHQLLTFDDLGASGNAFANEIGCLAATGQRTGSHQFRIETATRHPLHDPTKPLPPFRGKRSSGIVRPVRVVGVASPGMPDDVHDHNRGKPRDADVAEGDSSKFSSGTDNNATFEIPFLPASPHGLVGNPERSLDRSDRLFEPAGVAGVARGTDEAGYLPAPVLIQGDHGELSQVF